MITLEPETEFIPLPRFVKFGTCPLAEFRPCTDDINRACLICRMIGESMTQLVEACR